MVEIVIWNINRKQQALEDLVSMGADLALLQEVHPGGWRWLSRHGNGVEVTPHDPRLPWTGSEYDRWPLVVKLSDRVQVDWFELVHATPWPNAYQFPVSGLGTITAARVRPASGQKPFIAASVYGQWRAPHPSIRDMNWIHGDASVHRIISDLSVFISPKPGSMHRILAGGDFNMGFLERHVDNGRSRSVIVRMEALGMEYLGPQTSEERRVATFHTRIQDPATADIQLDHVFASNGLADDITVRAMNGVDEWGPSDHCRIVATLAQI